MASARLSHPLSSTDRTFWFLAALLAIAAAGVIIAMPMYHDHAIYWRGGERLRTGHVLRDDYLVKQPGIYALFAASAALFAEHEWSYRALDAIVQLCSAALLSLVAFRIGGHRAAALTCMLYLTTYSANAYVLGSHPESYVGILLAALLLLRMSPTKSLWKRLLEGGIYSILVMFKVTFGIIPLATFLWDIGTGWSQRRALARHWLAIAVSTLGLCALIVAVLSRSIAWETIPDVVEYLRFYASLPPIHLSTALNAWHALLRVVSEQFTILAVATALAGWLRMSERPCYVLNLWALWTVALAASIVIERKFGIVHLWRMLPMLVLPAAIGLHDAWRSIRNVWERSSVGVRVGYLFPLICVAFVCSPLPRFVYSLRIPVLAASNSDAYTRTFEQPTHNVLHRMTLWRIAGFIHAHRKPDDHVLVVSACMAQLPVFLGEPEWYHFATSLPVLGTYVPTRWRILFEQDVRRADWLVVSTLDRSDVLFGHHFSSWEALQQDTERMRYIHEHFKIVMQTSIAIVLHRRAPHVSLSEISQ